MSEWQDITLGELTTKIGSGATPRGGSNSYKDEGISLIRSQNVLDLQFTTDGLAFIDDEQADGLKNVIVEEKDVLLNITGDSVARVCMVPNFILPARVNQHVSIIRADTKKAVPEYLLYNLISQKEELLMQSEIGATRKAITKGMIEQFELKIPPLEEQRAIASVLSSLDDKIDLLHRQNQTLEQMAETLFREWFIEKADDDWEEGILGDEFNFTMGQSPPGSSFNEEGVGIPMYQGNRDFGFRFPENRVFTTVPKRFAEKFDTLISVRAPVGEQNMANEKCCIGRGVAAFRYKAKPDYYTYTYFKMKSLMNEIKQFNETGTVFGSISKSDFQEMEVSIPPINVVEIFQKEVKPIDDKIITNCNQIRTLTTLRDTLLPKLMSGEVKVI